VGNGGISGAPAAGRERSGLPARILNRLALMTRPPGSSKKWYSVKGKRRHRDRPSTREPPLNQSNDGGGGSGSSLLKFFMAVALPCRRAAFLNLALGPKGVLFFEKPPSRGLAARPREKTMLPPVLPIGSPPERSSDLP
jgi:hypothetical protein